MWQTGVTERVFTEVNSPRFHKRCYVNTGNVMPTAQPFNERCSRPSSSYYTLLHNLVPCHYFSALIEKREINAQRGEYFNNPSSLYCGVMHDNVVINTWLVEFLKDFMDIKRWLVSVANSIAAAAADTRQGCLLLLVTLQWPWVTCAPLFCPLKSCQRTFAKFNSAKRSPILGPSLVENSV